MCCFDFTALWLMMVALMALLLEIVWPLAVKSKSAASVYVGKKSASHPVFWK